MPSSQWCLFTLPLLCGACGSRSALLDSLPVDDGSPGTCSTSASSASTTSATTDSDSTSSSSSASGAGGGGGGGTGGAGGAAGAALDPILSMSAESEYETTTDLKLGPNGLVVVAWVAHPAGKPDRIGFAFSFDEGLTFSPPAQIASPSPLYANEPTIAINAQGEVFLSWMGTEGGPSELSGKAIFVARAATGETAFGEPIKIAESPGDNHLWHPRLGITALGTLIEVYQYLTDDHWTAASAADGVTWLEHPLPKTDLAGGTVERATPCTVAEGAAPGRFAVVHESSAGFGVIATEDESSTWNATEEFPDTTSEPRCVLSDDRLYVAGNNTFSIYLRAGAPGASSAWLLDKSTFQYKYVFRDLSMAVDSGGQIHLGFYTHSNDIYPAEGYRTLKLGATAGSPFAFTFIRQPLDVEAYFFGVTSIGEYAGLAAGGNRVFTSYTDNSSGVSHIAFHWMELPSFE